MLYKCHYKIRNDEYIYMEIKNILSKYYNCRNQKNHVTIALYEVVLLCEEGMTPIKTQSALLVP
jgi:hypothetical protein